MAHRKNVELVFGKLFRVNLSLLLNCALLQKLNLLY